MGAITDTVSWYIGMDAVVLMEEWHGSSTSDVSAYGVAGSRTLVVEDGSLFGNFASGKAWSLLTWGNEVVEVLSVDGNTLTLKQALSYDTFKARYLYGLLFKPYEFVRIYGAKITESFNTDIAPSTEKVKVDVETGPPVMPTAFFDMDLSVTRSFILTGFITTDRRRTTRLYREALWNLARLGRIYIFAGLLDDYTSSNSTEANHGLVGYIITDVQIGDNNKTINTGESPSGLTGIDRDKIEVSISLTFAPKEGSSTQNKELVEVL